MVLPVKISGRRTFSFALVLLIGALVALVNSGANNLHMYDGIRTQDIVAGDVFFEIVDPPELEYTYRIRPAKDFGGSFEAASLKIQEGRLVPAVPSDACEPEFSNEKDLKGNIALVERGECSFLTKAINIERIGGLAVIITEIDTHSDDYDFYIEMIHDKSDRETSIPAAFLLGKNGLVIRKTLTRLNRRYALINLPVNLTFVAPHHINQPPWLQW